MHTNKYLEKIASFDTNDDPEKLRKSLGIGYGMGMVGDAWRKDLNKQAEHPSDDVGTTTLINKITNPISWAAKIDLAGNTSTRVAALALNTLAREASKSDEHHNIPGPIQYRV